MSQFTLHIPLGLFTRCQQRRWSDNDDSLHAVGFIQSAEITVDSCHCENAGKRVTGLQKFESNRFTFERSFTSAISKALLASSATLWITCEEFFQTIFWPTLTVIIAVRNAMLLMFTVPFSAVAGFCGAFRSLAGGTFAKRLGANWSTVSTHYCDTWGHGQHRRLRCPLQSLLLINCDRRSMIRLYQRRVGRTLRAYFIKLSIRLRLCRTVIGP